MKHINTKVTVLVNLQGIVDFAQEITKLTAHLKDIQARKEKLEGKMSVEAYVKVPEDIKERDSKKLAELTEELKKVQESISRFQELAKSD